MDVLKRRLWKGGEGNLILFPKIVDFPIENPI